MLILASASPRRRELLALAGVAFTAVAANADETLMPGTPPGEAVRLLARRKAEAVLAQRPEALRAGGRILAADTLVFLDGAALGKPGNGDEAARMLRALSGRTHEVRTGFCILGAEGCACGEEKTLVEFYPLSDGEIDAYVRTGEPLDKAGAYGIQGRGALLVRRIEGDYYNVMGLPIARVARLLARGGTCQAIVR